MLKSNKGGTNENQLGKKDFGALTQLLSQARQGAYQSKF